MLLSWTVESNCLELLLSLEKQINDQREAALLIKLHSFSHIEIGHLPTCGMFIGLFSSAKFM